jgi:DNA-binding response OmpR family regulator
MTSLLIADDDLALCDLLKDYLRQENLSVFSVNRGDEVLQELARKNIDMLILDVMLPGLNGFDVLKQIRERRMTLPVLMLTARGDDVDRIVGLESGADDYLPKPFNPRELLARVRSILRRVQASGKNNDHLLANGPLTLNDSNREVRIHQQQLALTTAEFELLSILMESCGQVISKEDLAQRALKRSLNAYDRSIDVHLSHLRKKIEAAGGNAQWIISIRNHGYQLVKLDA